MVDLFLAETSLKQEAGDGVKKGYIGRVRCIVSHHVEQPRQLAQGVPVQRVGRGEGGLHTT